MKKKKQMNTLQDQLLGKKDKKIPCMRDNTLTTFGVECDEIETKPGDLNRKKTDKEEIEMTDSSNCKLWRVELWKRKWRVRLKIGK